MSNCNNITQSVFLLLLIILHITFKISYQNICLSRQGFKNNGASLKGKTCGLKLLYLWLTANLQLIAVFFKLTSYRDFQRLLLADDLPFPNMVTSELYQLRKGNTGHVFKSDRIRRQLSSLLCVFPESGHLRTLLHNAFQSHSSKNSGIRF